jgi:hypothetical protein
MSARINLIGQGYSTGNSLDGVIHIDRSMPGILHQHMGQSQWNQFCDRIDSKLSELGPIKKQVRRALQISGIVSLVTFGVIAGLLASGVFFRNKMYYLFPIFGILFAGAPIFIYFRMVSPVMTKVRKALSDLEMVCSEESSKYSNLSFHLRDDRVYTGRSVVAINYIEVSMGSAPSTENAAPVATTNSSGSFSLFSQMATGAGVSTGGRNVAERLKELEGIRSLISEEEYNQKRSSILSDI